MNTEALDPALATGLPTGHAPVILLVEDEAMVRDVTRRVLEQAGYRVLESSNAGDALQAVSRHQGPIDLLLTDMVMPGMDGAELAHRLRSLQPGLISVFMSGYAEGDLLQKLRGMSALHIQKPFTVDALLTRIGEALNRNAPPLRRPVYRGRPLL